MRLPVFALMVLALATQAHAEQYVLADDAIVEGAPVLETTTTVQVMTKKGVVELHKDQVVTVHPSEVSSRLRERAEHQRAKVFKKTAKTAKKALREYGKADSARRVEIEALLRSMPPAAIVDPLGNGLDDPRQVTRAFAVRLLGDNQTRPAATDELLKAAMTSKRQSIRELAHETAAATNPERTQTVYQAVAQSRTKPDRRVKALGFIEQMNRKDAVPGLIAVLEYVRTEIRTALATAGGLKRVPVDLGSQSAAGSRVPIELPEMQLVEVNTTISVPTLRAIQSRAGKALNGITGQDLGVEPEAWQDWWDNGGKEPDPQ